MPRRRHSSLSSVKETNPASLSRCAPVNR
jgi:hypothetical protein